MVAITMEAPNRISAFPWRTLTRLPRASVPVVNEVADGLSDFIDMNSVAATETFLSRVFKSNASLSLVTPPQVRLPDPSLFPHAALSLMRTAADHPLASDVLFILEAGLAHALVTVTLSTAYLWPTPSRPAPPAVHEACGALLLATGRHLGLVPSFQLHATGHHAWTRFQESFQRFHHRVVALDGHLKLNQRTFGWSAYVLHHDAPTRRNREIDASVLGILGTMPIALPIVGAVSATTRALLSSLRIGDAWMPDSGWLINANPTAQHITGEALLCAPGSELAITCQLRPDGTVVVGEEVINMQDPQDMPSSSTSSSSAREASEVISDGSMTSAAMQAIADAPILVRVELGTVSLTAEQWTHIAPGSILTTGHPVGQQVILRVANVEIARGELVNVEGELGVRIQSISTKGRNS